MPDHEIGVLLVTHLHREFLVHQEVIYVLLNIPGKPLISHVREIGLHEMFKSRLDILVLGCRKGIGLCHVVIPAVRTGHIGDVPDGIRTRTVLESTAAEGIGEPERMFFIRTEGSIGILLHPFAVLTEGVIHEILAQLLLHLLGLCILRFQRIIGNGVKKPASVDADGGFEAYTDFRDIQCHSLPVSGGLDRDIIGIRRDDDLRIDETVCLPVRELVAPLVGIIHPVDLYLRLVKRSLERGDGLRLRHTRERCEVGIGLLVIEDKEIAVAHLVIAVRCRPLAVSVPRMAHEA